MNWILGQAMLYSNSTIIALQKFEFGQCFHSTDIGAIIDTIWSVKRGTSTYYLTYPSEPWLLVKSL